MASRLEAIAIRGEVMASRLEAIAIRGRSWLVGWRPSLSGGKSCKVCVENIFLDLRSSAHLGTPPENDISRFDPGLRVAEPCVLSGEDFGSKPSRRDSPWAGFWFCLAMATGKASGFPPHSFTARNGSKGVPSPLFWTDRLSPRDLFGVVLWMPKGVSDWPTAH